jgi:hypothetical protein
MDYLREMFQFFSAVKVGAISHVANIGELHHRRPTLLLACSKIHIAGKPRLHVG